MRLPPFLLSQVVKYVFHEALEVEPIAAKENTGFKGITVSPHNTEWCKLRFAFERFDPNKANKEVAMLVKHEDAYGVAEFLNKQPIASLEDIKHKPEDYPEE
jgi:hypothetical protein